MDPTEQEQQQLKAQLQRNTILNGEQIQQQHPTNNIKNFRKKPYVKITEQPASKALRFRYECEGRSAGSIPGVNSTPENKTYPTIEIEGYKGRAVVVVSCITKDQPYRPHPHNLVGKEGCKKGVCTLEINPDTMRAVFSNLGIQCVKKKDIDAALKAREEIRVDPFKTGFSHRFQPSNIDLNSVRLCFQVFTESDQKGRFTQPLAPVVSEPIFDKKAMSDLVICRLCSCSATVLGNTQIILLCEKVAKDDISVRFYEEIDGEMIWEAFGEFQHTDVHKQTAIAFKTPRYRKIDITEPAKVFIQLKRSSDGIMSEALPFEYVPLDSDSAHLKRKRQKTGYGPEHFLQQQRDHIQNDRLYSRSSNINCWNGLNVPPIKTELGVDFADTSKQPYDIYNIPHELTRSSQPISPSSTYTHNTASPYNMLMTVPTTAQANQLLISSNQQYNTAHAGDNSNVPNTPMDITDYNIFGQQTLQPLQPYDNNSFTSSGASHWEMKFKGADSDGSNNLNKSNTYTMHNVLISANTTNAAGDGTNVAAWNVTSNFHTNQNQLQQKYQQHQTVCDNNNNNAGITNTVVAIADDNSGNNDNTCNNNEHGLSTLLTFDSEQLVRINSEDQQMLRLSSEDLQISNLSIST